MYTSTPVQSLDLKKQRLSRSENRIGTQVTPTPLLSNTEYKPIVSVISTIYPALHRQRKFHREIKVLESHESKIFITIGEKIKIAWDSVSIDRLLDFIQGRIWVWAFRGQAGEVEVEVGVIGPIWPRNQSRTNVLLKNVRKGYLPGLRTVDICFI